jgi:hypothetical protein
MAESLMIDMRCSPSHCSFAASPDCAGHSLKLFDIHGCKEGRERL